MKANDKKRSKPNCRSNESQKRRRRLKRRRAHKALNTNQAVTEAKMKVENVVADNLKLHNQLVIEKRKRKELMSNNIEVYKKLAMKQREGTAAGNASDIQAKYTVLLSRQRRTIAIPKLAMQ